METIYNITGIVVLLITGICLTASLLAILVTKVLNFLGRKYSSLWVLAEYILNRKEYKEWKQSKTK
jgi:hypothetical protein